MVVLHFLRAAHGRVAGLLDCVFSRPVEWLLRV